jgi:hypothetical protein
MGASLHALPESYPKIMTDDRPALSTGYRSYDTYTDNGHETNNKAEQSAKRNAQPSATKIHSISTHLP